MSTRNVMTHRTLIERDGNLASDAYGQPDVPTWYALVTAQPCYFWEPSTQRGELVGERNADLYAHQLVLPLGVDITETDRINGVTDRRGRSISTSIYNITQIVRKPDHLLLVLKEAES